MQRNKRKGLSNHNLLIFLGAFLVLFLIAAIAISLTLFFPQVSSPFSVKKNTQSVQSERVQNAPNQSQTTTILIPNRTQQNVSTNNSAKRQSSSSSDNKNTDTKQSILPQDQSNQVISKKLTTTSSSSKSSSDNSPSLLTSIVDFIKVAVFGFDDSSTKTLYLLSTCPYGGCVTTALPTTPPPATCYVNPDCDDSDTCTNDACSSGYCSYVTDTSICPPPTTVPPTPPPTTVPPPPTTEKVCNDCSELVNGYCELNCTGDGTYCYICLDENNNVSYSLTDMNVRCVVTNDNNNNNVESCSVWTDCTQYCYDRLSLDDQAAIDANGGGSDPTAWDHVSNSCNPACDSETSNCKKTGRPQCTGECACRCPGECVPKGNCCDTQYAIKEDREAASGCSQAGCAGGLDSCLNESIVCTDYYGNIGDSQYEPCAGKVCGQSVDIYGPCPTEPPCIEGDPCEGDDPCYKYICGSSNNCIENGRIDGFDDLVDCTIDTCVGGVNTHTPDDSVCDHSDLCNDEYCNDYFGCMPDAPVVCTNFSAVSECNHNPDNKPFTLDEREFEESTCDPLTGLCSNCTKTWTHTCKKEAPPAGCNAECTTATEASDCADKCVGDTFKWGGSCTGDCTCTYANELDCTTLNNDVDDGAPVIVNGVCTQTITQNRKTNVYDCSPGSGCHTDHTVPAAPIVTVIPINVGGPCDLDGLGCTVDLCNAFGVCVFDHNFPCPPLPSEDMGCNFNPDNYRYTSDLKNPVNRVCVEPGACNVPIRTYSHVCWSNASEAAWVLLGLPASLEGGCSAQCDNYESTACPVLATCPSTYIFNPNIFGTCNLSTCFCDYGAAAIDCNLSSHWNKTMPIYLINTTTLTNNCTWTEQYQEKYRNYTCNASFVGCTYLNSSTRYLDTGNEYSKANETKCNSTGIVNGVCCDANCRDAPNCDPPICNADADCLGKGFDGVCGQAKCNTTNATHYCYSQFNISTDVCRFSGGTCDVEEKCTGSTINCPGDSKKSGDFCGICQTCDGSNNACTNIAVGFDTYNDCPAFVIGNENCTGDTCNGAGACGFNNSGVCRNANGGACDVAEICNGTSYSCPVNGYAVAGTFCDDNLVCNVGEACNGIGNCAGGSALDCSGNNQTPINTCTNPIFDGLGFTNDTYPGFTSSCTEPAGCSTEFPNIMHACSKNCATPATCVVNGDCPSASCSGTLLKTGALCLGIAGNCGCSFTTTTDCNSSSGYTDTIPLVLINVTTPTNECTITENKQQRYEDYTCNVSSFACNYTITAFRNTTNNIYNQIDETVCTNGTAGVCCSGVCLGGKSSCVIGCTVDANCTAFNGVCGQGKCNTTASNNTCYHIYNASTTVCSPSLGVCDNPYYCPGNDKNCDLTNTKKDNTVICRAENTSYLGCDIAETCDGTNVTCPADVLKAEDMPCNLNCRVCSATHNCTKTAPTFTSCASSSSNGCDDPDTCDAGGNCINYTKPLLTACGSSVSDVCNKQDTCAGPLFPSGICYDNNVSAGTVCDECKQCDGKGSCEPVDDNTNCTDAGSKEGKCCAGTCVADVQSCGEKTPCTNNSQCIELDEEVCTTRVCDDITHTCKITFNTDSCDDDNNCTTSDTCSNGNCTGTTLINNGIKCSGVEGLCCGKVSNTPGNCIQELGRFDSDNLLFCGGTTDCKLICSGSYLACVNKTTGANCTAPLPPTLINYCNRNNCSDSNHLDDRDDCDCDNIRNYDEGDPKGLCPGSSPKAGLPYLRIVDCDSDGTPNYLDTDDDGDGVITKTEINKSGFISPDNDSDKDGIIDYLDDNDDDDLVVTAGEDPNNDGNFSDDDKDNDGVVDYTDNDYDNDGVSDINDTGLNSQPRGSDNTNYGGYNSSDGTITQPYEDCELNVSIAGELCAENCCTSDGQCLPQGVNGTPLSNAAINDAAINIAANGNAANNNNIQPLFNYTKWSTTPTYKSNIMMYLTDRNCAVIPTDSIPNPLSSRQSTSYDEFMTPDNCLLHLLPLESCNQLWYLRTNTTYNANPSRTTINSSSPYSPVYIVVTYISEGRPQTSTPLWGVRFT